MCKAVSVPEITTISQSGLFLELLTKTPASILAEALMQLRTTERLALSLRYFHELPICDVASVMKIEDHMAVEIHARAISSLSKHVAGKIEQAAR